MKPKVVGMMVIGPGESERWLKEALDQRKELVDDMVIVGNNLDAKTRKMIQSYGWWFYEDDREWGIYQPKIKQHLFAKVEKLKPDWILPSDADEIYDKYFTKESIYEIAQTKAIGAYFYVINLWNDPDHYRHDRSFENIRLFKYRPDLPNVFLSKHVHCGLAPPIYYRYGWNVPYILKHYGLMKPEDREDKIKRYEKYDPNAKFKGREYYDSLKTNKYVYPFDEEQWHERVQREVAGLTQDKKTI